VLGVVRVASFHCLQRQTSVTVHYHPLFHVLRLAAVNGNGKADLGDVYAAWIKFAKPLLTFHLPSASGFSLGFFTGFYYG